jgi:hypothetical protein
MSIWYCEKHGLTGPMACCGEAFLARIDPSPFLTEAQVIYKKPNIKEVSGEDLLTQFEIRWGKMPYIPTQDNRKDLGFSLAKIREELRLRLLKLENLDH